MTLLEAQFRNVQNFHTIARWLMPSAYKAEIEFLLGLYESTDYDTLKTRSEKENYWRVNSFLKRKKLI